MPTWSRAAAVGVRTRKRTWPASPAISNATPGAVARRAWARAENISTWWAGVRALWRGGVICTRWAHLLMASLSLARRCSVAAGPGRTCAARCIAGTGEDEGVLRRADHDLDLQ